MKSNDDFTGLLVMAILFLPPILTQIYFHISAKNIIQAYLQSKGITSIDIQREWFSFDRDTMTFTVEYTAADGNRQKNRCKLHQWWIFLDNEIFWIDPL